MLKATHGIIKPASAFISGATQAAQWVAIYLGQEPK